MKLRIIPVAFFVLSLPLAGFAADTAPPPPGFTLEDLKAQIPMTPEGRFLMEVPQILNTSTDRDVQGLLEGQMVQTTGQLIADPAGTPAGTVRVYRAELLCCSAHVRECSVPLEIEGPIPPAEGSPWVIITGTLQFRTEGEKKIPTIHVAQIKKTIPPAKALLQ